MPFPEKVLPQNMHLPCDSNFSLLDSFYYILFYIVYLIFVPTRRPDFKMQFVDKRVNKLYAVRWIKPLFHGFVVVSPPDSAKNKIVVRLNCFIIKVSQLTKYLFNFFLTGNNQITPGAVFVCNICQQYSFIEHINCKSLFPDHGFSFTFRATGKSHLFVWIQPEIMTRLLHIII